MIKAAYLRMHVAIFLWGFTGIFGKAIGMSEGMIVWYRLIISSVGLLPLFFNKKIHFPEFSELLRIAGVGALVAFHWILFYASIKASSVSIALSCFSSVSLFTAILDPLFRRKLPKLPEILLGVSVIAGLYIIFSFRQVYFTGIVLAVASAFAGALFTVFNKRLTDKHPPEVITFFELSTGFIILTLFLPLYFSVSGTNFEIPDTDDWIYLLLLGLICTSYAFVISLRALKVLDPFTLNLSVNLEPLYSIILAFFIFNENEILNGRFIAGTMIILSSVVIHTWYKWRNRV